MPTLPSKVQSGDLITADFMNHLVDVCADLSQRVSLLEKPAIAPTGLRIDSLLPSGTRHISDEMHIIGQGFDVPAGTVVTIDSIGVQPSPGIDRDRELIVVIPNLQGVTAVGKNITVLATNARGTDMQDIVVFPAIETVPEGQLFVTLKQPPADAQLLGGKSYTFTYNVQAIVNLDESYVLAASVDLGWTTHIVDASDNPIIEEIQLPAAPPPAGASQNVRVRVAIPGGTASGTKALLRLVATSKRNASNLAGRSGGESITVDGAPPPPMDVSISLSDVVRLVAAQPAPTNAGGVVRIGPTTQNYRLTLSAQIRADTVYSVDLVAPADNRWFASLAGGATPVLQKNIGPVTSATNQPIFVFLHAAAGAPDQNLVFSVTSTTDATKFGRITQAVGLQ